MTTRAARRYTTLTAAVLIATVLVSATLFVTLSGSSTSTKTTTETTTFTTTLSSASTIANDQTAITSSVLCIQTGIHGSLFVKVVRDNTDQPVSGANITATIANYCTPDYTVPLGPSNSSGYSEGLTWTGSFVVSVSYGGTIYTFPAQTSGAVSLVTLSIPSGIAVEKTIACYGTGCGSGNNTTTVTAEAR